MGVGTANAPRTVREQLDHVVTRLRRALAFWRRSLAVFLVVSLAASAFVMTAKRSYKSETIILYQESIRSGDLTGSDGATENARRVGARLREVLFSRVTLEPLVEELGLYPEIVERRGLVDAVDEMRKHVTFRAREGDTFLIAFEHGTREGAQEVARRLADSIVQEASSRRAAKAKTLKDFLDAESERNKMELRLKEGELAKFLALHPELAMSTTNDLHGAAPQIGASPDPELAALEWKAARIDRELQAGADETAPATRSAPAKLPDAAELVAARRDFEDKAGRYTDKHPDVIAARNRLRSAEAAQAAAQAAADQAAGEARSATPATEGKEAALKKQLARLRVQIAARRAARSTAGRAKSRSPSDPPSAQDGQERAVDLEVELRGLLREAADARERQRQLDDKSFKASLTASSSTNDRNIVVSVLDPAFLPTHPSSRPRSTTLAAGLAVALVLALMTALASTCLDDRIHDRADLEGLDILPVVGVVPRANALATKGG